MKKERIAILATSGAGLGHITRAIAIAKRLRAVAKDVEILFITSSNVLELIRQEGFLFYYIPSRTGTSKEITDIEWTKMVESYFRMIITYYKPKAVIYDAAFPYWMIYKVLQEEKVPKTVWIKRECYRDGLAYLNEFEKEFGLVIMPKELPTQESNDTERKKYVNPIVVVSQEEFFAREQVRKRYGIKKKELAVYVQLGAGLLCNVSEMTSEVIKEVAEHKQIRLMLGQYPIRKTHFTEKQKVEVLTEYPISKYFYGMDLAITAAGYNTVHELLASRLPSLLIPNQMTVVDDQNKRAHMIEEYGYGICLKQWDLLHDSIERLFREREKIQDLLAGYDAANGVIEAVQYILNYIESSGGEA